MGAKQTKEDETPTSPKSPRVSPVDIASGETPVPALLDFKEAWCLAALADGQLASANRINYLINSVDAAVRYGTQQTERSIETRFESLETTVTALETKIDKLTEMLQTLLDQQQS